MFFGCLSAGRVGGIVAGLAFILPGFILMLAASYLYTLAGLENKYFNASFRALQPIVAAMIFKATHKIADHSVIKHSTKKIDPFLVIAAICTAINSTRVASSLSAYTASSTCLSLAGYGYQLAYYSSFNMADMLFMPFFEVFHYRYPWPSELRRRLRLLISLSSALLRVHCYLVAPTPLFPSFRSKQS